MTAKQEAFKVALYARTSTILNQDPQLQITMLEEFASNRKFKVVECYVDQISGTQARRPALDRMLADAKRGKFQLVCTTALDRLGRNTKNCLQLFEELSHANVSVVSLRENLDFSSPMGKMILTVLISVAQLEKDTISERIRCALAAKKLIAARTGNGWVCGRKPLPSKHQESVLKLRSEGVSIRGIAKQLGIGKTSVERVLRGQR
jgi:site-specific DNA recombinase